MSPNLKQILKDLFYNKHGELTQKLDLTDSEIGVGKVPEEFKPDTATSMVCGYCSTGCSLHVHVKDGKAVNLTPTLDYPVNKGMACPKGWEAMTVLNAESRGVTPVLRENGERREVSWQEGVQTFVRRFKELQAKHGDESMAFLSTGQIPTEEMAFLGALAKFGMGWKHGDGNTRQCMATAVVAYKQSFGFDAPPYTYQDFEESDVIVLVGANLCIAHPIMWERVFLNPHDPKIVVIDPRKTETAMQASHHYPIKPKSDLVFFYALAKEIMDQGWVDEKYVQNHTEGFEEFKSFISTYTLEKAAETSGISVEKIKALAELIHQGKRVSFWWTMGVNQSHEGVLVAQAIINLALMTGNIGRPGTGANSITGQCNAMGSRLFSNTTNLLGHHEFTNPDHRQKVAEVMGINQELIQQENGLAYDQIVEEIARGKIKGLWVIATNSSHSWIHQAGFNDLIKKLDFLVVQDMYHNTESAINADLYLPAAGWGEKEGTFINSERRIGVLKNLQSAPGQALADFHIFKLIAHEWGLGEMFKKWTTPADVFETMKELSRGQFCDFSAIKDYQQIEKAGGIQWPFTGGQTGNQRRLFEDGRYCYPDGRAKFKFGEPQPVAEETNEEYPLILLTGRGSSSQWHTQTRTRNSEILRKLYPNDIYVEIHPDDAQNRGIQDNEWVKIKSRRAVIQARACPTRNLSPGQVFIPMHYEDTNKLTFPSFDPQSRQPSYKHCAVEIEAPAL